MVVVDRDLGRVEFRVYLPNATGVCVVGTFTQWEKNAAELRRDADGWWVLLAELPVGEYEFAYIIDGCRWMPDYASHGLRRNDDGRWISTVRIQDTTTHTEQQSATTPKPRTTLSQTQTTQIAPLGDSDIEPTKQNPAPRITIRATTTPTVKTNANRPGTAPRAFRSQQHNHLAARNSPVIERDPADRTYRDTNQGHCPWPRRPITSAQTRSPEAEETFRRIRTAIFGTSKD